MSVLNFLRIFSTKKVQQSGNSVVAFLNSVDRETCTETQIQLIRDKRDEYGRKRIDASAALEEDYRKTELALNAYNRAVGVLTDLKARHDKGEDVAEKAAEVNVRVGELKDELALSRKQDEESEELVKTLTEVYNACTDKLNSVKSSIDTANRRIESAQARKDRQDLLETARGESSAFADMDIIVNAMNKEADKIERELKLSEMNKESATPAKSIDDYIEEQAAPAPVKENPFSNLDA